MTGGTGGGGGMIGGSSQRRKEGKGNVKIEGKENKRGL